MFLLKKEFNKEKGSILISVFIEVKNDIVSLVFIRVKFKGVKE